MGLSISPMAPHVFADELHFNLRLTIHDYGRLVANSRACNISLDSERLKQRILDVARTDGDLDDDAISVTMDKAVEQQSHRTPGCSKMIADTAGARLDRDLTAFQYSIDN